MATNLAVLTMWGTVGMPEVVLNKKHPNQGREDLT
jgi:hypothetical protein